MTYDTDDSERVATLYDEVVLTLGGVGSSTQAPATANSDIEHVDDFLLGERSKQGKSARCRRTFLSHVRVKEQPT